jgi:hypothetical protein
MFGLAGSASPRPPQTRVDGPFAFLLACEAGEEKSEKHWL